MAARKPNTDNEPYHRFTGPQRLERALNSLSGLVQGIGADDIVKPAEVEHLRAWANEHREFAERHPFNELIPLLDSILEDGVVDDEELADLRWLAGRITNDSDYWDEATGDMQELHGFLRGVLADGVINRRELDALAEWVEARQHLRATWPYDELHSVITYVLADGVIDDQEHEALIQLLGEFAGLPGRSAVGALDRDTTISGVCAYQPDIELIDKLFCLTGTLERGGRSYVATKITTLGGKFHNGLRNDTDYLVVGSDGNPCWAYACYGRKIEDAVRRRRKGQKLLIVHEKDFWDVVDSIEAG